MAYVSVINLVTLLKKGLDPEFFELDCFISEEIMCLDKEDAFFIVDTYETVTYEQLLFSALERNDCGYIGYIPEILERCDEEKVRSIFEDPEGYCYDDGVYDCVNKLMDETKRWDLCGEYLMRHNIDEKKYIDYLVTEKNYIMKKEEVLPYIRALVDSLSYLPLYIILNIVKTTYYTHKYFQDWEIVSLIQLAKKEEKIYTNIPEYNDFFEYPEKCKTYKDSCVHIPMLKKLLDNIIPKHNPEKLEYLADFIEYASRCEFLRTHPKIGVTLTEKIKEYQDAIGMPGYRTLNLEN